MKKLISIIIVFVLCFYFSSCSEQDNMPKHYISQSEKSLEEMLTAHKWVHGTIGKGYSEVYCFNKNGTYEAHSTEYDGQVRHEEMRKGSWNISEDNTLSVKTDDSIATGEWVWDYNINDENLHSHHFSSNTWYVSDNYLLLGKEWLYTPMN